MFKLLRRISSSFTGWNEDGSSESILTNRKRRLDDDDEDDEMSGTISKRSKNTHHLAEETVPEETEDAAQDSHDDSPVSSPVKETEEVRQVIQGVKEVELKDEEKTEEKNATAESEADDSDKAPKQNGSSIEHPLTPPPEKTSTDTITSTEIPVVPVMEKEVPREDTKPEEPPTTSTPKTDSTPVSEAGQSSQSPAKDVEVNGTRADRPIKPLKRSRKADLNGAVPEPISMVKKVNGDAKIAESNGTKEDPAVIS